MHACYECNCVHPCFHQLQTCKLHPDILECCVMFTAVVVYQRWHFPEAPAAHQSQLNSPGVNHACSSTSARAGACTQQNKGFAFEHPSMSLSRVNITARQSRICQLQLWCEYKCTVYVRILEIYRIRTYRYICRRREMLPTSSQKVLHPSMNMVFGLT